MPTLFLTKLAGTLGLDGMCQVISSRCEVNDIVGAAFAKDPLKECWR